MVWKAAPRGVSERNRPKGAALGAEMNRHGSLSRSIHTNLMAFSKGYEICFR